MNLREKVVSSDLGDCRFPCLHLGFGTSEGPSITTILETAERRSETTSTSVRGFCVGCGITRTLEPCRNGHPSCKRCVITCHECHPKQRRGRKLKSITMPIDRKSTRLNSSHSSIS